MRACTSAGSVPAARSLCVNKTLDVGRGCLQRSLCRRRRGGQGA